MLILSPVAGGGISMAPIVHNLQAALAALESLPTKVPTRATPRAKATRKPKEA